MRNVINTPLITNDAEAIAAELAALEPLYMHDLWCRRRFRVWGAPWFDTLPWGRRVSDRTNQDLATSRGLLRLGKVQYSSEDEVRKSRGI